MFFSKINKRAIIIFTIFSLILLLIGFKVFYIQVVNQSKLKKLSSMLYSRQLPISADRGEILDRNGKILATSITTSSIIVVPSQIKNKQKVAEDISKILNVSYEDIYEHLNKKSSIEKIHPEGRNLSSDIADKINNLNYDGIYLVKESKRYYPYENLLSHTLGYTGIDNQGLSGIELEYDKYLKGQDGSIKYFSDGKGQKLQQSQIYDEPTNGNNIMLTIDLDLQLAVENELDIVMDKYNPDNALIIVEDPNNGEILAMGSRPGFDANNYKNYSSEIINRNLPIWKTYEPGSTFKIVTLASSIEEKTIDIFEDKFVDGGSIKVDGSTLHCWKHEGHGLQTYLEVVENSCNPGFVSMGLKLGKEKLMYYINRLGFGEKTGIDLNGESSGIMFDEKKMGLVETATTAFGQGISVTPIQQVNAVSAIINGGMLLTPFIVKNISSSDNSIIYKENLKREVRKVISKETSDTVRFALESVVAKGTGHNAYIENYRVAGKTGTAQKVENGVYSTSSYILSFIGFMPADNPKLVIYVAVDSPKNVVQYGGTVAAPIAKNVLESAISIFDVSPSKEVMPKEYTYLDIKYVQMPKVTGLSIEESKQILKGFNVIYSGNGEKIIYQSPEEGTYIKEGGTVSLLLS